MLPDQNSAHITQRSAKQPFFFFSFIRKVLWEKVQSEYKGVIYILDKAKEKKNIDCILRIKGIWAGHVVIPWNRLQPAIKSQGK